MGVGKQLLQGVTRAAYQGKVGLAGALVAAQQLGVGHAAPVGAGVQHTHQFSHIAQAQVQALTSQRVHVVGGVARQHPGARGAGLGELAAPAACQCVLQRPHFARALQRHGAQGIVAGSLQGIGKFHVGGGLQGGGPVWRD